MLGLRRPALDRVHPGAHRGQERLAPQVGVVEALKPAGEGDLAALAEQLRDHGARLGGRGVGVAGREQVVDREIGHAARREPFRRAAVDRLRGASVSLQPGEQMLAQEGVIPEPAAVGVQRDDELVGRGQVSQDPVGARPVDDRVAQVGGHAVEDRGPQQEVADVGRGVIQQLRVEVVGDVRVPPGDAMRAPSSRRRARGSRGARRGRPRPASPPSGRAARVPRGAAARGRRARPAGPPRARRAPGRRPRSRACRPLARRRATGSPASVRPATATVTPRGR